MLLALTIISTVAGVVCALAALWGLLQQRRQHRPQYIMILLTDIKALRVAPQPDHPTEGFTGEKELPEAS